MVARRVSAPSPRIICLAAATLCGFAGAAKADWFQREEAIMGTRVAVELWTEDAALAERAMDAVIAEMRRTDELMSTYRPESLLSRVNDEAARHPVVVVPEIIDVVEQALEFSRLTDGAFDVTYASVGYLYDYRERRRPSEAVIEQHLPAVDYRQVVVNRKDGTIRFRREGVRIDLGGIAKGYAVDRSIELLSQLGIRHAMVNAGGDTRLLGDRDGRPWVVGVRDPRNERRTILRMPLEDESISTSGDYERYFEEDGVRYHHILEPGTGKAARGIRSVTVIGSKSIETDALSTSVFVLGIERGMQLVSRLPGFEAVIVDDQGEVFYSDGLTPSE